MFRSFHIARSSFFGRGASVGLIALAGVLGAEGAGAAPSKDAEAEKVLKDAMDSDYFETRFDKAEEKLRKAIETCGSACSNETKAKLYAALGTVLAGGRKELEDGRDAFIDALKLDPKVQPDPDLTSAEVSFAFEKAKGELKMGTPTASASAATHKPPSAQRVRTPVPLYVEIAAEQLANVRKVTGSYAGPGSETFEPLAFRKIGERGFGAEVPCEEVGKEGELRYFITVLGDGDKVIATFGSRGEPLRMPLQKEISSEAPRWPGFAAPDQCRAGAAPDQCLDDRQCNSGLVCQGGQCVAPPEKKSTLDNWVTVSFAPDLAIFSGQNVCTNDSQNSASAAYAHFVCLREDGSRYVGTPTKDTGDNINAGFSLGTLRVAAQYERRVLDNLTVGVRLGFAFNGASGDGVQFLPVHVEGRVGYSLGRDVFGKPGLRPFGFVSGGLAQLDSSVRVQVLEDATACGAKGEGPCTKTSSDGRLEPRTQYLNAYKQAGNGFASLGIGVAYMPVRNIGFHLAVRGGLTFPVMVGFLAPEAGITLGF
ncbi:MAG: hypothetical protein U0441_23925 [Polyangiaceae bacterium]